MDAKKLRERLDAECDSVCTHIVIHGDELRSMLDAYDELAAMRARTAEINTAREASSSDECYAVGVALDNLLAEPGE